MDSPLGAAAVRGIIQAIVQFALVTLGGYQAAFMLAQSSGWPFDEGLAWKMAAIAGGIAALTALGGRVGVEGGVDQHRADTGAVQASDVAMASERVTVISNATGEPVAGQKQP